MSKNLHLVPKIQPANGQKFDAAMSCLTLSKADYFTVDIIQTGEFHKDAPTTLPPFKKMRDEEFWKMPEGDTKKRYVANLKKRQSEEAQYAKDKAAYDEKIKQESDTLSWLWQAVNNGMKGQRMEHNPTFAIGLPKDKQKRILFPEFLVGGGFVWLEAFTNNDPATGKIPHGLFIRATGTPSIVRVAWTDQDGEPIIGKVKFGSTVLLNIYTSDLYGQDVEVELWDRDSLNPNDLLPISNKGSFTTEVLVHELLSKEIHKVGVDGSIRIKGKSVRHVQKIKIAVLVDLKWKFSAGEQLKIYPTIRSKETGRFLDLPKDQDGERFLEVAVDGETHQTVIERTNNPALVGEVETDISEFQPCRYDEIKITVEKEITPMNTKDKQGVVKREIDKREVVIYSKADKENKMYLQPFEMVAGFKENLAEVIIDLADLDTGDCRYEKTKPHTGRVIDITPFQGKKAWKDERFIKDIKVGMSISGAEGKFQVISAENPFGYIAHTDSMVRFQVAYLYEASNSYELLKYFIPSTAKSYSITIPIETCHKGRVPLQFIVYPDIKWTLKIAFNLDRVKVPGLKTSVVKKEAYVSIYMPIPDFILQCVKYSIYFVEREYMEKKTTFAKVDLSLTAQLDQEDDDHYSTEISVSGDIKQKIEGQLAKLGVIGELMQKLFEGSPVEDNKAKQKGKPVTQKEKQKARKALDKFIDGGIEEYAEGDLSKKDLKRKREKLEEKLNKNFKLRKRSVVEPEITWPSLGLSFSWSLSEGKTAGAQKKHLAQKTGYKLEAALFADPIIGMGAKLDFLALIARAHPIATAVMLVVDAASAIAGVSIDLYFQAEGKFAGELNGFLDTLTGDNTFNRDSLNETSEKVAKFEGSLKFTLEGTVSVAGEANLLLFVVSAEGTASIKAEAEFKLAFGLHANDKGFYLQPVFTFEGLEIEAKATIKVKDIRSNEDLDKNKGEEQEAEELSVSVSYQVIDRVIRKLDPIELHG